MEGSGPASWFFFLLLVSRLLCDVGTCGLVHGEGALANTGERYWE